MRSDASNVVVFKARSAEGGAVPVGPAATPALIEGFDRCRNAFKAIMQADIDPATKAEIAVLMQQIVVASARVHILLQSCASDPKA